MSAAATLLVGPILLSRRALNLMDALDHDRQVHVDPATRNRAAGHMMDETAALDEVQPLLKHALHALHWTTSPLGVLAGTRALWCSNAGPDRDLTLQYDGRDWREAHHLDHLDRVAGSSPMYGMLAVWPSGLALVLAMRLTVLAGEPRYELHPVTALEALHHTSSALAHAESLAAR